MVKINPNKVNEFIANPGSISTDDLSLLNKVCDSHPYFQATKAIRLKSLKEQESYLYNIRLKETAAFTQDRSVLFEFITSNDFLVNDKGIKTLATNDFPTNEEVDLIIDQNIFIEKETNQEETIEFNTPQENKNLDFANNIEPENIKISNDIEPVPEPQSIYDNLENLEFTPVEDKNIEEENDITINPDEPLNFEKSETHSFAEWLKLSSLKPIQRDENFSIENNTETKEVKTETETKAKSLETTNIQEKDQDFKTENSEKIVEKKLEKPTKKKNIENSLIDKFIENNPKIPPVNKDRLTINLASINEIPTSDLMTETLAKVYIAQKNYKKAIQAYKILSLKNPEKSGLFADQIRAIEKLKNNNS